MSQSSAPPAPPWHARPAEEVAREFDVDPRTGLSSAEAARRLERHGPNRLAEAAREPRWRAFLRQFEDLMVLILLVAAVVSLLISREWESRSQSPSSCCSTPRSASCRSPGPLGTGRLARRGAIVKRLSSVETLGSTSQICTDKTGTLTLNEMTARELLLAGRRFTVSGQGYHRADGRIRSTDGAPLPDTVDRALTAMALCSDAVVHDGDLVGDPTEGALVVPADKGDLDVAALRRLHPRTLEIPFDSDHKFMATFHRWTDDDGNEVVRCFVKGAPDVLSARADRHLGAADVLPFDDATRARYEEGNAFLAEQGMRVMAVAYEDFPAAGFDPGDDPKDLLDRLVLVALVGIVDPPRPEARDAVAQCRAAGIRVRMLTGDHAVTAGAIARELGIPGQAITGADLDAVDDDVELARRLDEVGVVARVSPAHKIRIVRALKGRGEVVAMTGDGVNDAPALRNADIGVASPGRR